MCDLSAIGIGLSVVQAGASYISGSQQASATSKYNRQLEINSLAAYDSDTTQGQTQHVYQDIKAAHSIDELSRTARANEATAINSAGEAGVGGNTLTQLSRDFYNRSGKATSDIITQRDAANNQIEQQIIGAGYQYQNRLAARPTVHEPSLFGAALTAAGGAFNSVSRIKPGWAQALFGTTGPSGNQGEDDVS